MSFQRRFLLREEGHEYLSLALTQIHPDLNRLKLNVITQGYDVKIGYLPLDCGLLLAKDLGSNTDFIPKDAMLTSTRTQGPLDNGDFFLTLKGINNGERREAKNRVSSKFFVDYWSLTQGQRILKRVMGESFRKNRLEIGIYQDGRDLIFGDIEFASLDEASRFPLIGKDVTEDEKYQDRNLAR